MCLEAFVQDYNSSCLVFFGTWLKGEIPHVNSYKNSDSRSLFRAQFGRFFRCGCRMHLRPFSRQTAHRPTIIVCGHGHPLLLRRKFLFLRHYGAAGADRAPCMWVNQCVKLQLAIFLYVWTTFYGHDGNSANEHCLLCLILRNGRAFSLGIDWPIWVPRELGALTNMGQKSRPRPNLRV